MIASDLFQRLNVYSTFGGGWTSDYWSRCELLNEQLGRGNITACLFDREVVIRGYSRGWLFITDCSKKSGSWIKFNKMDGGLFFSATYSYEVMLMIFDLTGILSLQFVI